MDLIEFKNLPDTTAPISAENLNNNFNKLNKMSIYSTTETRIGTWLGKPLYRKVIDIGNLPNTGVKNNDYNVPEIDLVIKLYGFANNTSGGCFPLPYVTSSGTNNIALALDKSIGKLNVLTGGDRSSFVGMAIIEYTKTTD